jgi:ribosome biogenesis GTPase
VCNVDQAILVFSSISPDFSFRLLDRFLIILSQENLTPILVISKIDLVSEEALFNLKRDLSYYEKIGYEVYYVNSKQKIGIDVLEHVFERKLSVLAGQTGVGKSTLLNALMPELKLKTQEISKALGRGKHTTRHTELYPFNKGYIVDTPGFSKIEFQIFHADEIKSHYPDFEKLSKNCKFKSKCMHHKEPGCEVKKQVENQTILASRYENYLSFMEEVKQQKEKY